MDNRIGRLTGRQNEGPKLRTARDEECGISTISKPFKSRILLLDVPIYPLKMALAQKDHNLTCLEGKEDGQQRKWKGISKCKDSNRLSG